MEIINCIYFFLILNILFFRFNFAEAAVIIDGSTNIYSKKVDYLLEQARACLDLVSVSKNDKQKKRKGIFYK